MEYTQDMYNEDMRISRYIFNKKFKFLTAIKDDMLQSSLILLYRYRDRYNSEKGTYLTYASKISYCAMLSFLKVENKQTNQNTNLSIDFEYEEDTCFADMLGEEQDFDTKFNAEYLEKVCNKIIDKHKSKTFKNIARLYISGKIPSQVAKELNISRQCAWKYIDKFKNLVKETLKEEEYF